MTAIPKPPEDTRRRAYTTGARMARERLRREAPLDADALAAVTASDIVVVSGTFDHVELVLELLELPHRTIDPSQVERLQLRPEQLLIINCPGNLTARAVVAVRDFVAAGGSLFTTDWALRNVIEPAFPNTIKHNGESTSDTVVRIETTEHDNPFLRDVMDPGDDPLWWLEGSSYPITVLDPERVQVLLKSSELGAKWGEAPVAVTFRHGEGEVFHMISHYFLQRTETRTKRHQQPAEVYAAEKGIAVDEDLTGLTRSDLESAYGSARFMAGLVAKRKRAALERERSKRD